MATIVGTNVAIITVKGLQGTELTQSTMEYYPSIGTALGTANEVCQAWITATKTAWLALVSIQWTMLSVKCVKKTAGVYTESTIIVGEAGAISGEVLPVYNTFSLVKIPDNAERDPPAGRLVGKGRVSLSGIPEAAQDNGIITAPYRVIADVLAETLEFFVESVDPTTFSMYIQSLATIADPTEEFAPVLDIQFNRLGTQLTRKS